MFPKIILKILSLNYLSLSSFQTNDYAKVRFPRAEKVHPPCTWAQLKRSKVIHRTHFHSHTPWGADPGLEQLPMHCGWPCTWESQTERVWVAAVHSGRDCASHRCRLVFSGRPWRMARASVKHMGPLSSSFPLYAPPPPAGPEINPSTPPYGVFGPLGVVLTKQRWPGHWKDATSVRPHTLWHTHVLHRLHVRFGHVFVLLFLPPVMFLPLIHIQKHSFEFSQFFYSSNCRNTIHYNP